MSLNSATSKMGIPKERSFSNEQVMKFSRLPFISDSYLKIPHFSIKITAIALREFNASCFTQCLEICDKERAYVLNVGYTEDLFLLWLNAAYSSTQLQTTITSVH